MQNGDSFPLNGRSVMGTLSPSYALSYKKSLRHCSWLSVSLQAVTKAVAFENLVAKA